MRLAENTGRKHSLSAHHRTNFSSYIFATKTCNDNRIKTSNISPRCPHNMVNFGPLMVKISWRVWGTPANFNWFRVVIYAIWSTVGLFNRGRHVHSAGRPSLWAWVHILV